MYGGLCGATAIELTPQKHTESPVLNEDGTFKEPTNQNIKFTGSMDVTGRVQTNGDTKRFNAIQFTEGAEVKIDENTTLTLDLSPLSLLRGTIIDLVGTSVHAEDIVSHVVKQVDDKEVFTFILLQFAFPSGNYSTFESDQMIELKDIKDEMNASGDDAVLHTEHKYIIVPLNSALGPLGYALLLNYHYEEPTN